MVRPKLPIELKMIDKNIRFTPAQVQKLLLLGGAKWLRKKVDQAKVK